MALAERRKFPLPISNRKRVNDSKVSLTHNRNPWHTGPACAQQVQIWMQLAIRSQQKHRGPLYSESKPPTGLSSLLWKAYVLSKWRNCSVYFVLHMQCSWDGAAKGVLKGRAMVIVNWEWPNNP